MQDMTIENNVLVEYRGNRTDLEIPDGVTEIAMDAFKHAPYVRALHLPDSLIKISPFAFAGCGNLQAVNLAKVKVVDFFAFSGCRALRRVDLSTVEYLGNNAFDGCEYLKEVVLSKNVTKIPASVFRGCSSLEELVLPATVTWVNSCAFDGCHKLCSFDFSEVNRVAAMAFRGCGFYEVTMGEACQGIDSSAFEGCKSLRSVKLPGDCAVDPTAFDRCNALHFLYIGKNVVSPNPKNFRILREFETTDDASVKMKGALAWLRGERESCISEKKVLSYINKTKDALFRWLIENKEFEHLPALLTATKGKRFPIDLLDETMDKNELPIEVRARLLDHKHTCYTQEELDEYETEQLEKSLGIRELSLADWEKILTLQKTKSGYVVVGCKSKDPQVVIPESIEGTPVTAIADRAFFHCETIQTLSVPDSVESIGKKAFAECPALESVRLSEGLVSLGDAVFAEDAALKEVNLPPLLTVIPAGTFEGCKQLKSIILPKGVKKICENAFSGCRALKSLAWPSDLEVIGKSAFLSCIQLRWQPLPERLKIIEDEAFELNAVQEFVLPRELKKIGYRSFGSFHSVELTFLGTKAEWNKITVFEEEEPDCSGYDRWDSGKATAIHCTDGDVEFMNDKILIAYYGNDKDVIVPDGTVEIHHRAFSKPLHSVIIPKSVKRIQCEAFKGSDLHDIYYEGSKSDWYEIDLEIEGPDEDVAAYYFDWWAEGLSGVTVHCIDGNIVYEKRSRR